MLPEKSGGRGLVFIPWYQVTALFLAEYSASSTWKHLEGHPEKERGITNMQKSEVDVLVVGAGPTGLTMACELLRRGITCRILDKAAASGMTSRAVGVQARTLEVFDRMGIIEEVLARGVMGASLNIYERDTRLLHMNFRSLANDAIPYPYSILLPQHMTEELLIALLHTEGGAVERLKEVTELRQEAERVCVTLRKGWGMPFCTCRVALHESNC
jgi:2-polyprenyl-6-methoxyphenol hydroxylase-like FAD-dependent oxidoreductase